MLVRRMVLMSMSMDQLQESLKTIGDELKGTEERRGSFSREQGMLSRYAANR